MDNEEEDIISELQDCLLIDIISRLPKTKEAISTDIKCSYERLFEYASFVEKTLTQCRHLNLNKFQLLIPYDVSFESQVNDWVRYAVRCNVQELDIFLESWNSEYQPEFVLDEFFFSNSCFTCLKLGGCVINPTGAISWSRLKSLHISTGVLDEDLIQNILSGCPLLETLELVECYGYTCLDITSKSVKNLVFSGYVPPWDDLDDTVVINAPYVLSLTIQDTLLMWKLLLLDVSSVVEAKLDYWKGGHYETTTHREEKEEMFKGFILKLRNVKELTIGSYCEKVFTCLKAKGLIFPSNLKYLHWSGHSEEDEDSDSDSD